MCGKFKKRIGMSYSSYAPETLEAEIACGSRGPSRLGSMQKSSAVFRLVIEPKRAAPMFKTTSASTSDEAGVDAVVGDRVAHITQAAATIPDDVRV